MSQPTLHYIHDPLCGWCYAAAPLLRVARGLLPVQAHAGGMMAGAARRPITPELREFVVGHDRRIAQLSGQPFGSGYVDGLLRDTRAVLDSEPPITALLAADAVGTPGAGLDLLARLQHAHYVEGRRIADASVLLDLARDAGMDAVAFTAAFQRLSGAATERHIASSRALLARLGGRGFPTLAIESGGQFSTVDLSPFLGQPEAWRAWLSGLDGVGRTDAAVAGGPSPFCGLDGCAV